MKIGIVGKGGVGKTTVTSLLARAYAESGRRVLAVDTDSNPNLGLSLGLSGPDMEAVPVLPRSLIVGSDGAMSAADLISQYGRVTPAGATLLSAIKVTEAGGGCTCGGHATVRSLLGEAIEEQADVTLIDMEAGLEHLSRSGGTLAYADILVVVMEPTRKSVLTAARTIPLAEELGIPRTYGIGNKAHLPEDAEFFDAACAEFGVPLCGVVPYDEAVVQADRTGVIADGGAQSRSGISEIVKFLDGAPVG